MEFAGEDLISYVDSESMGWPRFASPRSDLSRHQSHINLRNLSAIRSPCGSLLVYAALPA